MSLNIDGSDDPFFRYKMPDMMTKIEGRGNGIKTVITNMADIATALHRDPGYPTKYFATELGALSKWDDKRLVGIVNGEHSKETLAKLLNDFIKRYVLCRTCGNPETDLIVKKEKIYAKCLACGWLGLSDNTHKLATYIVNHPPNKDPKASAAGKPSKKEKRLAKIEKSKNSNSTPSDDPNPSSTANSPNNDQDSSGADDDAEADNNATATGEAGVANGSEGKEGAKDGEDGEEVNGDGAGGQANEEGEWEFEVTEDMNNLAVTDNAELDDPVEDMRKLLTTHAAASAAVRLEKIREFQTAKHFTDEETVVYVFKALVTDRMADQIKDNIKLIAKLVPPTRENQVLVISLIEERCEAHADNLKHVPNTLMALYEEDVLEEEHLSSWHSKGISQLVALADDKTARKTRKAADKFIEWLQTAEEESDEE